MLFVYLCLFSRHFLPVKTTLSPYHSAYSLNHRDTRVRGGAAVGPCKSDRKKNKTGPKTGPKNRTDDYIGLVS